MRRHYWIIEVSGDPQRWSWREHATARGDLDMKAYRSRAEAKVDLEHARNLYGHARLVKFVRVLGTRAA